MTEPSTDLQDPGEAKFIIEYYWSGSSAQFYDNVDPGAEFSEVDDSVFYGQEPIPAEVEGYIAGDPVPAETTTTPAATTTPTPTTAQPTTGPCPNPGDGVNSQISDSSTTDFSPGDSVTYECNSDHFPVRNYAAPPGPYKATCIGGVVWDYEPLHCASGSFGESVLYQSLIALIRDQSCTHNLSS